MALQLLAWGNNNSRALGLEGTEHNTQNGPKKVNSMDDIEIRQVSTGETHTLVCTKDGVVYSCGSNQFKQCGREGNLSEFEPVEGLEAHHVIQVATGSSHSVVLTQGHEVLTWGKNTEGQLGRGDEREETSGLPLLVRSLSMHHVVQVACGSNHTLVLTNEGHVVVWGSNSHGQLGLGPSTGSKLSTPTCVTSLSGIPVAQIAAGGNHSFVLSKSGAIYGWGRNSFGQLGLNESADSYLPKQCRSLRRQRIKFICCGENHTACLTADGRVLTFGAGNDGQLGHGSYNNEILPRQVMELTGCEVSQIACGGDHTLAYVPKTGQLYSFGLGKSGQLGLSTTGNNNTPMLVPGLFIPSLGSLTQGDNRQIRAVYAGGDHSFATTQDEDNCVSDDFRIEDPTKQILTLTQGTTEELRALKKDDIPSPKLEEELKKIFSSAACLNGSFLLQNGEHYESSSKNHGVDMQSLREFFTVLKLTSKAIMKIISTSVDKNLIPSLPQSPPDVDALRVYLVLPECPIFDQPREYSSLIILFARSILSLRDMASKCCDNWWSSLQPDFFIRLVKIYKTCFQYFLSTTNLLQSLIVPDGLRVSVEMLKKLNQVNEAHNQIVPYQEFYVPVLKDKINLRDDYIRWLQQKNGFGQNRTFCNYPFLFDGEAKSILLQTDSALHMQNVIESAHRNQLLGPPQPLRPFDPADPYLILTVLRENLVEDTLSQLQTKSSEDLKKPLQIIFQEELDYTGAGVKKEFFHVLFGQLMDPTFGMFTIDESSKLNWFNPATKKDPNLFKMIGILCGLAIYNGILIPLNFPQALYKKLLKRPVTLEDVKELDPVSGKSLQYFKDFDGNFEETFTLNFVGTQGKTAVELCFQGKDRIVDQSNKHEYIDLNVDQILNKSTEVQFSAFYEGFHSVFSGPILDLVNPQELESLMVGSQDYDFVAFQENTEYLGIYNSDHSTIKMFWEVFHELPLAEKKKFLCK